MFELRKAADRGTADHGWLRSRHSFSFADYYDPAQMGFSDLRVINDDRVAPAQGFGTHPHRNMEIISVVLDGELAHKDSMGNGSVIGSGEVQMMSAGSGITHSEFNPSQSAPVHFLQIWIACNVQNVTPRYGQIQIAPEQKRGKFCLIASPDGAMGSLPIYQDAQVLLGCFEEAQAASFELPARRYGYVHVAQGRVKLGDMQLEAGDGVKVRPEGEEGALLHFSEGEAAQVLVFNLRAKA